MTFPAAPPQDPTAPGAIRDHDWAAFQRIPAMRDHWNRPGWTDGRRLYYWMLPFHADGEIRDLAARCQSAVADPRLDQVPLDFLHLTVDRIGPVDRLDATAVEDVTAHAGRACAALRPFTLEVGPLTGSPGTLRLSVGPWSPLQALHTTVTNSVEQSRSLREHRPTSAFRPHISLAYSNRPIPVADLLPGVEALRTLPLVRTTVTAVSLVEAWREDRVYRYEEKIRIPLGG